MRRSCKVTRRFRRRTSRPPLPTLLISPASECCLSLRLVSMLFKVDENLPEEVAQLLLQAGHDALTIRAQGLQGKPDSEVLAVSSAEGRALITLDQGFTDIRRYPPGEYPGRIVLRIG